MDKARYLGRQNQRRAASGYLCERNITSAAWVRSPSVM